MLSSEVTKEGRKKGSLRAEPPGTEKDRPRAQGPARESAACPSRGSGALARQGLGTQGSACCSQVKGSVKGTVLAPHLCTLAGCGAGVFPVLESLDQVQPFDLVQRPGY